MRPWCWKATGRGHSFFLYRLLGAFGVEMFATWLGSARVALATMFLFTAISHFAPMFINVEVFTPKPNP